MLREQNQLNSGSAAIETRPAIAVLSRDESILKMIAGGFNDSWILEKFDDPHEARPLLLKPGVRIVVIDDEAVDESMRGWLLDQVRKCAPQALVAYIAAIHTPENERRARKYRVQYYTSKPMDHERILRVLHSFERASQ